MGDNQKANVVGWGDNHKADVVWWMTIIKRMLFGG